MKKGFFKMLRTAWGNLSTADKINLGIDIVCGVGAAMVGKTLGDTFSENCSNRFERLCVKLVTTGGVLAGAEAGANYLKRNYGDTSGLLIDCATGKAKLKSIDVNKDGIEFKGEYTNE